ncbi:MAG: uracil-DNA glycosylase [Candidatus Methylacidiphilales bacterium]|nr:uracil-DNA glycosylase [Candidatus Methylacidiphilales bacterium]
MNLPGHELLTAYLQSRYRLGERELELPAPVVAVLRAYRRPGTTSTPAPARPTPRTTTESAPVVTSRRVASPSSSPSNARERLQTPSRPAVVAPLALPEGTKQQRLDFIAAAIQADTQCRMLFQRSKNMVFGVGSPDAAILFVGEAPGEEEDLQGEPFVGRAGQLLTKMIQAMGLQRSGVYIANVCKYRPDMPEGATGNRKPTSAEMAACLPYLRSQISVIGPQAIVALGATAVEGLFSLPRAPIMKMRGEWMEWEGIPVMPTYHPAYLLRNESVLEKRKVWEDLLQVMEKTGLPVSEKQRNFFRKAS